MLLVFAAHFADNYWGALDVDPAYRLLRIVTRAATPAFLLISGAMLGLLHSLRRREFARIRARLIDRSLFLLLIAHPLIAIAHIPRSGWRPFHYVFVTDTIAFCVIVGCLLVPRVGRAGRLVLALVLFGSSWALIPSWLPPLESGWRVVKDVLVGFRRSSALVYSFPLLPWLALYLVGTALGEGLGSSGTGPGPPAHRLLLRYGSAGMVAGMALKGGYWMLWPTPPMDEDAAPLLYRLTSPSEKLPPGSAYFLFYGGLALVMTAGLFALERAGAADRFRRVLKSLGRASLFIFVTQYYVYNLAIFLWRPPHSPLWPAIFALMLVPLVGLAIWWDRAANNRLLSVGYPRWAWLNALGAAKPEVA